jgi:hypothetical protein
MSSRLSLRRILDGRRFEEADVRFAKYVRPLSRGLHVVRNSCNEQEVVVSSAAGSRTFKPATEVPLGSHTATPGELILGLPPTGRQGASTFGFPSIIPGSAGGPHVISADPLTALPGSSGVSVTLTGTGFESTAEVLAFVFDESALTDVEDPDVTVVSVVFVSSAELTITVDYDASLPSGYPVAYGVRN